MKTQHRELASSRWRKLSFCEQMANIGSEVGRALSWRKKEKSDFSERAFIRALELLNITINCHVGPKLKELTRVRALPTLSPFVFGMTIVFGILLMTISYLAIVGFSNFDLNLGTVVLSSELIFAPLFALIIFSESPTGYEWIGGLFIVLAIVIPNVRFKKSI